MRISARAHTHAHTAARFRSDGRRDVILELPRCPSFGTNLRYAVAGVSVCICVLVCGYGCGCVGGGVDCPRGVLCTTQ
jgi:hypothetical protein